MTQDRKETINDEKSLNGVARAFLGTQSLMNGACSMLPLCWLLLPLCSIASSALFTFVTTSFIHSFIIMSDPSGFITNPPSTIVKVVNTARDDMNGQLGIAIAFQESNGRYLVHNVATQQTIALRPDNLVKASTVESVRGQYLQLRNDPRVQQKVREHYDKAKQILHPVQPEYVAVGLLVLWCLLIYAVGFTKTIMVTSVVLLLGVLVAPDVMEGASWKRILQNVPQRSRQAMEETVPALKGRLSNKVAGGIVIFMIVMAGQSLFWTPSKKPMRSPPTVMPHASNVKALQQEYYKLGFDDAKNGFEFGTSLTTTDGASTPRVLLSQDEEYEPPAMEFDSVDYGTRAPKKRSFGFASAMSAFYLYRTASELGTDVGGGFSFQRMVANARTLEPWKLGMVGFSLYNLVRSFI